MATTSKIPRTLPFYVGLLSIGFGMFDFLMAPRLAEEVGMKDGRIFRAAGVREIVTGAGAVLMPANPIPLVARLWATLQISLFFRASPRKRPILDSARH